MNLLDLPEDILKQIDMHVKQAKKEQKELEHFQNMMERIHLAQSQMEYRSNRIIYGGFF